MNFNKYFSYIYSYCFIAFVGISSAVLFCIACIIRLITAPFDRRRIVSNLFSAFWASLYIWCMPLWSVRVIDRDKLTMKKNYVLVSNHQSQLDILVLYHLFFPFRWVSKAAVFKLPFIGWNMFLNGYIKLHRRDHDSIKSMMQTCENLLKNNISVFFFPEGTRSKDGLLRPFKPGAFILAKKTRVPILPVVLNHTKDALPKHSLRIRGRRCMEVQVLDEIAFSEFENMEVDDIARMVRDKIASHVKEHQDQENSSLES
ncbi:MAG: 1-acyl-sn-glycerol-3-phosphate acyltransferase [Desulfobacteraceae bacterium]|nr:1-acyl-sn-glycerol-3-phosphate acyltransferase [Desulfobacteraceae bacterium]